MSPIQFKRLSDESLGSRLASGEAAAFDELYRRYAHRLAAYGSHLLGDAAAGDDVAQSAMLKAYGALRDGRVPARMKPWLFRIAHNAAIDLVARRRELPSDNLPEQPAVDREPFAGALVEALATLPERQRRVYVLREVHGLRIDETAAELELTAAQVEQSLFAARNRLAEQLVFGDRLNCVTVQRLAGGPLDTTERRALKTHLRTCRDCRQSMGLRGRALSLFPSGAGLEWLRGLGAGLLGGGVPAAAKVGAVFATATIAAGGTVAVQKTNNHHARASVLKFASATPVAPAERPAATAVLVSAVSSPTRAGAHPRSGSGEAETHSGASSQNREADQRAEHDTAAHDSAETDSPSHAGGSRDSGSPVASGESDHTRTVESGRGSTAEYGSSHGSSATTSSSSGESHSAESNPPEPQDPPEDAQPLEHPATTTTTSPVVVPLPPPPVPPVTATP